MKLRSILVFALSLTFVLVPLVGCKSDSNTEKVQKKISLSPRGKKVVRFKTHDKTTVTFHTNFSSEDIARCKNNGVRMTFVDSKGEGERITSTTSGNLKVWPEKGKVKFMLENLEAFPIKVYVNWTKTRPPAHSH